jgi:2-methylcitrate dehydratase
VSSDEVKSMTISVTCPSCHVSFDTKVRAGVLAETGASAKGVAEAAALELRPKIGNPERIRSIDIATFQTAVEIIGEDPEKWRPRTRETADHSLPYCTAVELVDGVVSAEQFSLRRLADPDLLDLVSRTRVIEDPRLTAGYPAGTPNRVTGTLDDGSTRSLEVTFPPGHAQNPLSDDQLATKFQGLVVPILGASRADAIWNCVAKLENDRAPHDTLGILKF